MYVPRDHLKTCVDQANLIRHAYGLERNEPLTARSVTGLHRVIEQMTATSIEVFEVDADGDQEVQGMCILLPDQKAQIAIVTGLNRCWNRFVWTKELFHVALERDEYRSINLYDHVEEITTVFPADDATPSPPVAAEYLAEVGALELLFPYKERELLVTQQPKNFLEIATRYLIPKVLAERYLSASFMKALAPFERK